MKKRICMGMLAMVFLIGLPTSGYSALVFDAAGGIIDKEWVVYDFTADVAPYNYVATIKDESVGPEFGFNHLYLMIIPGDDIFDPTFSTFVDLNVGYSSISFGVQQGDTVQALIYGEGGGELGAGAFRFQVNAIPIPPTFLLLGSGILAVFTLRRKK